MIKGRKILFDKKLKRFVEKNNKTAKIYNERFEKPNILLFIEIIKNKFFSSISMLFSA